MLLCGGEELLEGLEQEFQGASEEDAVSRTDHGQAWRGGRTSPPQAGLGADWLTRESRRGLGCSSTKDAGSSTVGAVLGISRPLGEPVSWWADILGWRKVPTHFQRSEWCLQILFPEVGSQERSECGKAGGPSRVPSCLQKGAGSEWAGPKQQACR